MTGKPFRVVMASVRRSGLHVVKVSLVLEYPRTRKMSSVGSTTYLLEPMHNRDAGAVRAVILVEIVRRLRVERVLHEDFQALAEPMHP